MFSAKFSRSLRIQVYEQHLLRALIKSVNDFYFQLSGSAARSDLKRGSILIHDASDGRPQRYLEC